MCDITSMILIARTSIAAVSHQNAGNVNALVLNLVSGNAVLRK